MQFKRSHIQQQRAKVRIFEPFLFYSLDIKRSSGVENCQKRYICRSNNYFNNNQPNDQNRYKFFYNKFSRPL